MDTKDITAVLLKTAGLIFFAYAIFELPLYFPPRISPTTDFSIVTALVQAAATLTLPIVLGLLLWFFPATVTNKIVSGEKLSGARFGVSEFERVALTVLGVWLVAYGVTDLIYDLVTLYLVQKQYPDMPQYPPRTYAGVAASTAKILIGVGLALGAKGISRLVNRMRGDG